MDKPKSVSLRDILSVIFKNKFFILWLFITAMLFSYAFCILVSPVYEAKTKILVKIGREKFSSIDTMAKDSYNVVFQERTQNINNEIELLKSSFLTKKIFPRLKTMLNVNEEYSIQTSLLKRIRMKVKEVIGKVIKYISSLLVKIALTSKFSEDQALQLKLNNALQIEFLEDTDVIEIRFQWGDPNFAADALNIYTEAYLQHHAKVHKTDASLSFYYDQINTNKAKLEDIEKEILDFEANSNISDISIQRKTLLSEISDIENTLRELQIEQSEINLKLKQINRMDTTPNEWVETPNIGKLGKSLTDLSKLDQTYFNLKAERDAISQVYLASRKAKILEKQMELIKHQKAKSLFNILNTEKIILSNQETYLNKKLKLKQLKLAKLNIHEMKIEQLNRDRDVLRNNYLLYTKKGEDLRISKALDKKKIFSVKIMEPALPPLRPKSPKKLLILSITAFLSLFIGFGYSVIHEYFDQTFEDADGFDRHLDIPLLLTIPKSKYFKI